MPLLGLEELVPWMEIKKTVQDRYSDLEISTRSILKASQLVEKNL